MALFFESFASAYLFFRCYYDDIRVRRYVREQGEHCGARAFNIAGDFGVCSFGCIGNAVCSFIYSGRACRKVCEGKEKKRRTDDRGQMTEGGFNLLFTIDDLRLIIEWVPCSWPREHRSGICAALRGENTNLSFGVV